MTDTPFTPLKKLIEGYALDAGGKPIVEENNRIGTGYFVNRGSWDVRNLDLRVHGFYKLLCDALGRSVVEGKVIIAGGGVRTAYNRPDGDTLSDIDVFFVGKPDDYSAVDAVNKYLDNSARWKRTYKCPQNMLSTYVSTDGLKVQIITPFIYQNVEQLLNSFDFTISEFAYDGKDIWVGNNSVSDLNNGRLRITNITYPWATIKRVFKYQGKGFKVTQALVLDILDKIRNHEGEFDPRWYID